MGNLKSFEILKAVGKLGSNFSLEIIKTKKGGPVVDHLFLRIYA